MAKFDRSNPYDWRRRIRTHLPFFLINLGVAGKGKDCEEVGARHLWYNYDNENSGCYYCRVREPGQLWEKAADADTD
jgi:hypothetical protein